MRLAALLVALLAANVANAGGKRFGVHAMTALTGEIDVDKIKFKAKSGQSGSQDGDDEDLEGNIGVAVTYEVPIQGAFTIGGRGAFLKAEGDDSETEYSTFDGGAWARYLFMQGKLEPFAAAGLGATYATSDPDGQGVELSGFGWHFLIGGGISYAVSSAIDLYGGAYFLRQAIFEAEGDGEINGIDVDVTAEDVVLTRFVVFAGLMF